MCDERNQLCQCYGFMLLSQKLHLHCQFESFNFSIQKPVLPGGSHYMHEESLLESLLEWTNCVCLQISVSKVSLQADPSMAPAGQEGCHAFWYTAVAFSFQTSNQKSDGYQGSPLACPFHIEILIFKELYKYCYNASYPKIKLTSDKSFMRAGVTQQEKLYSWCDEYVEKVCEIPITAKLYIAWRCMQANSERAGWAWIIQDSFR